ncbi:MAG: hypothetical protein AAB500_00840 [Patescibacteria group bacterium]
MDEETIKKIKERYDMLPESIKEIIMSSNYQDTLIELGKKYNLNVGQLGILERETTMVLMGLTNPDNFQTEIIREMDVDAERGRQIVKEINEEIFARIRDLLKLMNTPPGEEPKLDEETPAPSPEILKAAGVTAAAPDLSKPELPAGMLAQKLSGSFQIPSVTTDHTTPNVTPEKPKVDPYREPLE